MSEDSEHVSFPPGGNGSVSLYLQNQGFKVLLIELEFATAIEARNKGVVDVICSTFNGAHLEENKIPAIGLFDVLEHIHDDVDFLRRLKRVLCSNGIICLTVPAFEYLWSEADEQAGHYRRYTATSLSVALQKAGFHVKYASFFFSILVLPILAMRSLPYRLGISYADTNWRHKHHMSNKSLIGDWMGRVLRQEIILIGRKFSIPFGSSCLMVAQSFDES